LNIPVPAVPSQIQAMEQAEKNLWATEMQRLNTQTQKSIRPSAAWLIHCRYAADGTREPFTQGKKASGNPPATFEGEPTGVEGVEEKLLPLLSEGYI